jgi:hypothetical protein
MGTVGERSGGRYDSDGDAALRDLFEELDTHDDVWVCAGRDVGALLSLLRFFFFESSFLGFIYLL